MTLIEPASPRVAPLFADDLTRHGDRPALVAAGETVSYAALDERVGEVAAILGHDRRLVLVAASNTVESVVAYLAALRGRHPVIVAPPDGRVIEGLANRYEPDVVVGVDAKPRRRNEMPRHELHDELAVLSSTSGSTGSPKLVRLSRENLRANAAAIAAYLALTDTDRAITTLPMQYCYGLSVINSHLSVGASIVLTNLSVVDRCFWALFARSGATSLAGVPHTFDLLDRAGFASMTLPSLRYITQAGGRLRPDTVYRYASLGERHGWELFVMYGQTEATARMAYLPPELARSHAHTIGVPIPGGAFAIDDPDPDGVGELVYRGPNVMLGYARTPADLAAGGTVDALHTGDLARRTVDGLYEIVGRRSRFIKPFGLRVDLDQVERALTEQDVTAACTGDDEQLIVAVEGGADSRAIADRVVADLGLPRSHVQTLTIGELPRLDNGKSDYAALRQLAADHHTPVPPMAGSCDLRSAVHDACVEILGVTPNAEDSFVTLGGDSLSYVEMSVRLEELLGDLPRDWHATPFDALSSARQSSRRLAPTDTTVVLRAVAIVLIVGTHTKLWHLPGGAHTLLAVAGFNFARFQLQGARVWASIARVALPSVAWIGAVAAVSDKYGWPNALLINGIIERPGDRWGYWFIEALVWILVPLTLVFRVSVVSRLERRFSFAVALGAVVAGLAFRFDIVNPTAGHETSRPHEVFWLFALGWAAARAASSRQRLLVTAVAAPSVIGFFGDHQREAIVWAGIALTTWLPTVPLPRVTQRLIAPLAGASLYIYLTHFQVFPPLDRLGGPLFAVAGSVVIGVMAWKAASVVVKQFDERLRSRSGPSRGDQVQLA